MAWNRRHKPQPFRNHTAEDARAKMQETEASLECQLKEGMLVVAKSRLRINKNQRWIRGKWVSQGPDTLVRAMRYHADADCLGTDEKPAIGVYVGARYIRKEVNGKQRRVMTHLFAFGGTVFHVDTSLVGLPNLGADDKAAE